MEGREVAVAQNALYPPAQNALCPQQFRFALVDTIKFAPPFLSTSFGIPLLVVRSRHPLLQRRALPILRTVFVHVLRHQLQLATGKPRTGALQRHRYARTVLLARQALS